MKQLIFTGVLLGLLAGCQANTQAPKGTFVSAQVLRDRDDSGLVRNDARSISTPDDLKQLQAFFPDLQSRNESTLQDAVQPWIVVRFHKADGTDLYAISDYHIYKVDNGTRGDFVVEQGFIGYVQDLFNAPK